MSTACRGTRTAACSTSTPRLFAKAGLMRGGKPVLPNSPDELLAQARQFEQRTGKPYLIQSNVGDPAFAARNLYTYMMAQGAVLFPDAKHIRLEHARSASSVANFFRRINVEKLGTQNMDTPAAIAAFVSGEGGIYPTGTWMIGSFEQEAKTPGRPLYKSYAVFPYPRLWGEHVEYVSGHSWVVPTRKRTRAAARGHRALLPLHGRAQLRLGADRPYPRLQGGARRSRGSRPCRTAPTSRRSASIGRPLPGYVLRQTAIEGLVGEEAAAAFTGQKSVPASARRGRAPGQPAALQRRLANLD